MVRGLGEVSGGGEGTVVKNSIPSSRVNGNIGVTNRLQKVSTNNLFSLRKVVSTPK